MLSKACSREADAAVKLDENLHICSESTIKVERLGRPLMLLAGRVDVQCNLCETG